MVRVLVDLEAEIMDRPAALAHFVQAISPDEAEALRTALSSLPRHGGA